MKGNKMSAILAILLMLSGALFIPHAIAAQPVGIAPSAMGASPVSIVKSHATFPAGSTFTVSLTITGVTGLFTWGAGVYFNPTYLKVASPTAIVEGGFLSQGGTYTTLFLKGAIDNVNGIVKTCGDTLTDGDPAASGSGILMNITFTTLSPPYTGTSPGTPIQDFGLVVSSGPAVITLQDYYGTYITPPETAITNGTFTLTVVPVAPTASFTITSPVAPPYYVNDLLTFDGSASTPGSDGINPSTIVNYQWNFGDGNITNTPGPIVTHAYPSSGTYIVTLIVTNALSTTSAPFSKTIQVIVKPTGCVVDVFTQPWRYIDPIVIPNVPNGKGYNQTAELFRPGDLVILRVLTAYNGYAVQNQMVAYEVWDNLGNIVLSGVMTSNGTGIAEADFRIPWPCTGVTNEFGTWKVMVTWEIGNMGAPYGSLTQNDTMTFKVGWGVWSDANLDVGGPYNTGDTMTIKYTLHNDYQEAVDVLNEITVYDTLMVPIGNTEVWVHVPAGTSVPVTVSTIVIPKWAFVGAGTVKGDELTQFPSNLGTAWGPEQVGAFVIAKGTTPSDP